MERLDISVCCYSWIDLFPFLKVTNLEFWSSDHKALLVEVMDEVGIVGRRQPSIAKRFYFKAAWATEEDCRNLVCDSWGSDNVRCDMA